MVVVLIIWQVGSVPADTAIAVGTPRAGPTTTVLITCNEGPLQPLAVTRMSTVPKKLLAHDKTPAEEMLPAAALLKDQFKPVLFIAEVVYVVVVVLFPG